MQHSTAAIAAIVGSIGVTDRICGGIFATNPAAAIVTATICSRATPFRVRAKLISYQFSLFNKILFKIGVHFDGDEATFDPVDAAKTDHAENWDPTNGAGRGFWGFYLNYWQVTC